MGALSSKLSRKKKCGNAPGNAPVGNLSSKLSRKRKDHHDAEVGALSGTLSKKTEDHHDADVDALSGTLSRKTEDHSDADVGALSGTLSRKTEDHHDADDFSTSSVGALLRALSRYTEDHYYPQVDAPSGKLSRKRKDHYDADVDERVHRWLETLSENLFEGRQRKIQRLNHWLRVFFKHGVEFQEKGWLHYYSTMLNMTYDIEKRWLRAYYTMRNMNAHTVVERSESLSAILSKIKHEYVDLVDALFRKESKNTEDHSDAEGCHECEVFTCGHEAAESEYNWDICTKNPGHHKFIPAPEFHLGHLPEWARHSSMLKYVQLVASLTVRVRVTFISWERPEGDTFHNYRGSPCPRVASGFIQDVCPGDGPCPCRECKDSPTPAQEWFWVYIETACHVVYDTSEAQFTEINVFYDDENSQTSGRMKTILALDTIIKNHDKDFCALRCATHDKQLGQEILQNKVKLDKILNLRGCELYDYANILCIIVSHPHGRAKTITVGEIERFIRDDTLMQVRYTTDTCPGSSGAPVLVLSFRKGDNRTFFSKGRGPHSETVCVEGKTLNMSAEFLTSHLTKILNYSGKRVES